jgi:heme/copper-type cytochrome/quinol oxidase subunit 1
MFALGAAMVGTSLSVMIRLELASAGSGYLAGQHHVYNSIVTAHALVMIFYVVMPGLIGGFAN